MAEFRETLYDAFAQSLRIDELLFENDTGQQALKIFRNGLFGRVMTLDGVVQTTEGDEFIYHEMLTHVPILAHGQVRSVLIIGGGDGGILREVCRHAAIERIVKVEIDRAVVEMSREYLPNHSNGAFDDPRFELVIDDGMNFVRRCSERFDVIITDSTDPIGPGEVLFTESYYGHCKRCLNLGGVLVTQNGVVYLQPDELRQTAERLAPLFADWHFYSAAVPTYVGGIMAFGWASDDPTLRHKPLAEIEQRFQAVGLHTNYYNPAIHIASFALPQYALRLIGKA